MQLIDFPRLHATGFLIFPRFFWAAVLMLSAAVSPTDRLFAHEVWIEPQTAHLSKGDQLVADLRIGDMFKGNHLIYIPQQTERLSVLTATGSFDLDPQIGSRPVVTVPSEKLTGMSGELVVVYQSSNSYLQYDTGEKFFRFAEKKGAADVRKIHEERQLPDKGFVERYKRFAKASITIGPDAGRVNDRAVGMELEFVSLARTPLSGAGDELETQLLYQGDVVPAALVTLFSRDPDGTITTSRLTTDKRGIVTVTARSGHRYLLDHVMVRDSDPSRDRNRPVWESLWASLTFSGPAY